MTGNHHPASLSGRPRNAVRRLRVLTGEGAAACPAAPREAG
ncbi:hypothetical protein EES44_10130 [Streptomyces sp. ADI96-15]|nr:MULTISPECIES: hypothetical protein [unclassified Streptomyces]RPK67510.1 hypothetical protein EES44_10130 [Streptomyces sp. ADI96-15]